MTTLLGIDEGTSAVKAVLFDEELRPIKEARREKPLSHPRPGWVEQDPEAIVEAVVEDAEAKASVWRSLNGHVGERTVLATTTHPAALVFAQALHALTFGSAHLAAMGFLAASVKDDLAATAQSVYSTVAGGIALGAGTSLAGALYERYQAGAYFVGVGLAAAGALLAVVLHRRSARERIRESAP